MSILEKLSIKKIVHAQKEFAEMIKNDYEFNASFRGTEKLSHSFMKSYEWKTIKCYRKFQTNRENILGIWYKRKLHRLELKTGISLEFNPSIGRGLIIGHWGNIVVNGQAKFGEQIFFDSWCYNRKGYSWKTGRSSTDRK